MLKYYASANSCNGYVSFLKENIADCKTVSVAEGTDRFLRQKIFKGLEKDCTELILKPGYEDDFEAIKTKDHAIVFRSEPANEKMYDHLKAAKEIHDQWEKIYISAMDFDQMDESYENLKKQLL